MHLLTLVSEAGLLLLPDHWSTVPAAGQLQRWESGPVSMPLVELSPPLYPTG